MFGASPTSDLQEKFADVLPFTQHVRLVLLKEISAAWLDYLYSYDDETVRKVYGSF